MIKVELHCHTHFSSDGFITKTSLQKYCNKKKIDCVCITDHDTMQGAVEIVGHTPLKIIVGQEVSSGDGDIIGLFLDQKIPSGLGIKATIDNIKSQGGIVYLPHPFDEFRKSAVKLKDAEQVKDRIDIIEIFNSRTFNSKYNAMALDFAEKNDIAIAVGGDAHHPLELGNSYMVMEDFDGPESFLKSVRVAKYVAKKCPFTLRLYIKALKVLTRKD